MQVFQRKYLVIKYKLVYLQQKKDKIMAKESVVAREGGVNPLNAVRTSRTRANALTKAGFSESNGTYTRDFGGGVEISLKRYETRQGETRYSSDIRNFDGARMGSFSESEVKKLSKKLSSMSSSEARDAVDSYIRDLFNPRLTQTEGDAMKLRKKYLGF